MNYLITPQFLSLDIIPILMWSARGCFSPPAASRWKSLKESTRGIPRVHCTQCNAYLVELTVLEVQKEYNFLLYCIPFNAIDPSSDDLLLTITSLGAVALCLSGKNMIIGWDMRWLSPKRAEDH